MILKFLKGMERFFERHIEGFFRHYFIAEIQPVEIGKRLVRAMEENLQISVTKTYAPNQYWIYLRPNDLERMQALNISLTEELAQYILKQAQQRELYVEGEPIIELQADADLSTGEIRIHAGFINVQIDQDLQNQQDLKMDGTLVFDRLQDLVMPFARHKAVPCTRLQVKEGIDLGKTWELGNTRMYLGRRETNEIPLGDMNASRVHAYIQLDEGYYVLHDAKSLNGTYVNGERITRKVLQTGDHIKIGHTILVYEVV